MNSHCTSWTNGGRTAASCTFLITSTVSGGLYQVSLWLAGSWIDLKTIKNTLVTHNICSPVAQQQHNTTLTVCVFFFFGIYWRASNKHVFFVKRIKFTWNSAAWNSRGPCTGWISPARRRRPSWTRKHSRTIQEEVSLVATRTARTPATKCEMNSTSVWFISTPVAAAAAAKDVDQIVATRARNWWHRARRW